MSKDDKCDFCQDYGCDQPTCFCSCHLADRNVIGERSKP